MRTATSYEEKEALRAGFRYSPFPGESSATISFEVTPVPPSGAIIAEPEIPVRTRIWTRSSYHLPEILTIDDWNNLGKSALPLTFLLSNELVFDPTEKLRKEVLSWNKLGDNWDLEGGRPLLPGTAGTALQVIDEVIRARPHEAYTDMPAIYPVGDGTIRFEWIHDDKELLFSIQGTQIEALRWRPRSAFEPEGEWKIEVPGVRKMVRWLFGEVVSNHPQGL